ncbi:MAG: DUF420 domain-containing protein [Planctomycetaceae bacterium]|nr:DUF420 domain-containing protein [Planctomycetaceae bacterium]
MRNCCVQNVRSLRKPLVAIVGSCLLAIAAPQSASAGRKQPEWPAEGIEDFSLTECHGQTVTNADLLGKSWLACFIFTECRGPCPLVSEQMHTLQQRLKGLDVRLVSFTVDPDRDTPEVLKGYAAYYKADPERWWFLTGEKEAIRRLIRRSFMMIVEDAEIPRPGFEIEHSTTIMHVNAQGRVIGMYNAQNEVDMARLRRTLLEKSDSSDTKLIEEDDDDERQRDERARQIQEAGEREAAATVAVEAAPLRPVVPDWVLRLPSVNASLNGLAALLLLLGFGLIKTGRREAHKAVMLSAFITSTMFLAFYLAYHIALDHYTGSGSRKFEGTGVVAAVYKTILLTHVVLAIAVAVMAPMTLYCGLTQQWERHKRLARITFPIWLYVSVTGVIIYLMLYHWPLPPV